MTIFCSQEDTKVLNILVLQPFIVYTETHTVEKSPNAATALANNRSLGLKSMNFFSVLRAKNIDWIERFLA